MVVTRNQRKTRICVSPTGPSSNDDDPKIDHHTESSDDAPKKAKLVGLQQRKIPKAKVSLTTPTTASPTCKRLPVPVPPAANEKKLNDAVATVTTDDATATCLKTELPPQQDTLSSGRAETPEAGGRKKRKTRSRKSKRKTEATVQSTEDSSELPRAVPSCDEVEETTGSMVSSSSQETSTEKNEKVQVTSGDDVANISSENLSGLPRDVPDGAGHELMSENDSKLDAHPPPVDVGKVLQLYKKESFSGKEAKPKGKPKSGKKWKTEQTTRFSGMKQDQPLRSSWATKMQQRAERKSMKTFEAEIKEAKTEELDRKKKYRAKKMKRKIENQRKSEIVQVIKNPAKIKRMKRRQLRQIEHRSMPDFNKAQIFA